MRVSASPAMVTLAFITVALSGCTDEPNNEDAASGGFDQLRIEADDETGGIRGVVIDPAIRPIPDATIYYTLEDDQFSVQSNDQGAFVISGLPTGLYQLTAEKKGYTTVQTQAEVEAGVETPDIIRVLLEPDPEQLPRVMVHQFDGYVQCSISTPAYRVAVCALVPESYSNDKFLTNHEIDAGARVIQSEMVWQSSQALGREMTFVVEREASDEGRGASNGGPSPLMVKVDEERMKESGLNGSTSVQLRVFNYNLQETEPPVPVCGVPNYIHGGTMCVKGVGATIEQDFTIYSHVFYRFSPLQDWRFTEDGDPQVPDVPQ